MARAYQSCNSEALDAKWYDATGQLLVGGDYALRSLDHRGGSPGGCTLCGLCVGLRFGIDVSTHVNASKRPIMWRMQQACTLRNNAEHVTVARGVPRTAFRPILCRCTTRPITMARSASASGRALQAAAFGLGSTGVCSGFVVLL